MQNSTIVVLATAIAASALSGCFADTEEKTASSSAKQITARFCPSALVPRTDMARYLERLKKGRDFQPPPSRGQFVDITDETDKRWAEALFDDGITKGCDATHYCPNDSVPREQMAAFIVRLFRGGDFARQGPSRFEDVTGGHEQFAGYIEELADMGITKGCDATHFCPSDMVPREQMAAFLMRAAHPGSQDGRGSGRYTDVPADNQFSGRIEQAIDEGIMEPCDLAGDGRGGPGAGIPGAPWDGPAPYAAQRFNVFAKSSIEYVNINEAPPPNSNFIDGGVLFPILLGQTNRSYGEYPSDDLWGASKDSEKYRLWQHLVVDTSCVTGTAQRPNIASTEDDGGGETLWGAVRGTHHLETDIQPEGSGWAVKYVLFGSPAGILEPTFQDIKPRRNTDIFQYGTVHVTCDWAGTPQASFNTYEGPSFGGSSFPSHHAWVYRDYEEGGHEHQYRQQSYSLDPDGAGMKDLWFLPDVPPAGGW